MAEDAEQEDYEFYDRGSDVKRPNGSQNKTGEGTAKYANGDVYDGTYVEGKRAGKGIYSWKKTEDLYEGKYADNKKHGFGKMTYTDKTGNEDEGDPPLPGSRAGVYIGYFAAGKRGCQQEDIDNDTGAPSDGTFTYGSGDVYVGQWVEGKKHGTGTYTYKADGTKLVGDWNGGLIVRGKWVLPSGVFWCGQFRYNKPHGHGVWVFKDGSQLTGEYIQKVEQDDVDGGDPDADDGAAKPLPKVECHFRCKGSTAVHGAGAVPKY